VSIGVRCDVPYPRMVPRTGVRRAAGAHTEKGTCSSPQVHLENVRRG
jgi:hypothetical protein